MTAIKRPVICARGGTMRLFVVGLLAAACGPTEIALLPRNESCLLGNCHGRVEEPHYGGARADGHALACADCHGGDPAATTIETAHVTTTTSFNPSSPGGREEGGQILANPTLAALDDLDPAVLKFLNPSDYRVVRDTCGSSTLGAGNCHTRITDASTLSTHATLAGQLAGGLYFGGLEDGDARYGVRDIVNPLASDRPGTVAALGRFPADPSGMQSQDTVPQGYFATFSQICLECHLSRDGVQVPGKYYSSGCNACHLLSADDGLPVTPDPTQDRREVGHGAKHRLTNLIPDSQCNRCHHAHLHRGLLIQGVREKSEPEGDLMAGGQNPGRPDPENVVFWPEENYVRFQGGYWLYGKPYPFYVADEDGTNDVDETPPDIHFEKGMACIDCHTMLELHGDANSPDITVRRDFEIKERCQSCHGEPGAPITAVDTDGVFERALSIAGGNGDNESVIRTDDADEFPNHDLVQIDKFTGRAHQLTQIDARLDASTPAFNSRTLMGCGLHSGTLEYRQQLVCCVNRPATGTDAQLCRELLPGGYASCPQRFPGLPYRARLPEDTGRRVGRVECFACHNQWTVNCFGCHITRDDRECAGNQLDGACTPLVQTFAMSVLADALELGFNARGRVTPMVGTSIFFSHVDESGNKVIDAAPMRTMDGYSGDGNSHNPVHHHTVRKEPRDCQGCHPLADGTLMSDATFKRAIGLGTGDYLFTDGEGRAHVLDAIVALDFDGDGQPDDPRTADPTKAAAAAWPLASSTHMPIDDAAAMLGPGPLDAITVNRMIENRVVPQRQTGPGGR